MGNSNPRAFTTTILFIDDTAYHFGASLKDLGKNTFFFTQEDFTLDEVLKESQKIQAEKENRALRSDNAD